MSLKKIGVGVIGTGMAAKPHALALNELKEIIDVKGVFSRNEQKCKLFAENYNFVTANKIQDILENNEIDMVIIITPPNQRLELVEVFSKAGKHILMEKPIERSTEKAKKIVNICQNNKVHLGVVLQHRFRESSIKLKTLIKENKLGSIYSVQVNIPWWRDQSYYDEPGRGTYERDGGGVLISQAIHTLDLMISLVGPVEEVQAIAKTTSFHKMESEDFVAGGFKFKNGAVGSLMASTSSYPGYPESIILNCEKGSVKLKSGTLKIQWKNNKVEEFGESSGTGGSADPMAFPFDWHKSLIKNFALSLNDNQSTFVSGEEALEVHSLIDALIASSNNGKLIKV
jgi:predicted dehydrogenase